MLSWRILVNTGNKEFNLTMSVSQFLLEQFTNDEWITYFKVLYGPVRAQHQHKKVLVVG